MSGFGDPANARDEVSKDSHFLFDKDLLMSWLSTAQLHVQFRLVTIGFLTMLVSPAWGVSLCGTAADGLTAERAGLTREWIVQLPFDSDGYRLSRVDVGSGLVVAQSDDGLIHAVLTASEELTQPGTPQPGTPRAGSLLWSTSLGRPRFPVQPAGMDQNIVTATRDMDCCGLDPWTGSILWRQRLPAIASAGSLPVGDWVYIPLRDATVYRLPTNPYRQPGSSAGNTAEDENIISPAKSVSRIGLDPLQINSHGIVEQLPAPYAGGAIWCTHNGHLTAIEQSGESWARHEFHLRQKPNGPVAVSGQTVFAATVTGELARFEDAPGGLRLTWRTLLETRLHANQPRPHLLLSNDTLLVSLDAVGVAAHDATTGKRKWITPLEVELLAVVGERLWCYDKLHRLTALSLVDGSPTAFLDPGPFTLPVTNRASEKLILASPRGLLVSLAAREIPKSSSKPRPAKSATKTVTEPIENSDESKATNTGMGSGESLDSLGS